MATDATAIIAIPEALLETAATRHFEGTLDLAELAAGPDTYTFAAPVSWSVEATNTGDAIPDHALPRLWEAYYQADPSRSTKGDGLGLSIAKTVFDLHGYTCGTENTDAGPKFWFKFA